MKYVARIRFQGPCHPETRDAPWWVSRWSRPELGLASLRVLMQGFQGWYSGTQWEQGFRGWDKE